MHPMRDGAIAHGDRDVLSSSISSNSISSPGCRPSSLITSRASSGRLKLVLLLDRPLPGRFDGVEVRPVLEKDVRRDDGAEPPPVAPVLLVGDAARSGDSTVGLVVLPRSSAGISAGGSSVVRCRAVAMATDRSRLYLSPRCIARKVSLAR